MARPLVLQGTVHPTVWTPAYADTTRSGDADPQLQEYRIMVSIAVPTFDRKLNSYVTNETRFADLLGVAGTDVPIKDMEKLTYNYKSGVNGYAFIVTNNGYILLHPDLRPVFRGILKKNYNSVDLTEVELLDDTNGPRKLSPEIEELRNAMVNHSEGKMLKLRMKFHYDDIRRVALEHKNYYFAPLKRTPFTMGLSLPDKYGMYYIKAGDEVQKSRHENISIISYLQGSSWKIHPDWTYCKYHHQTHTFESPEDEMKHFLEKMRGRDWVWAEQYEYSDKKDETMLMQDSVTFFVDNGTESFDCNRRPTGEDEYYCDRELVQLFVFDARVTKPFFSGEKLTDLEQEIVKLYNVTLKFVSTQSGLTRWLHLQEHTESEEDALDFGDLHTDSIDEPYYRSAVLHYGTDPASYVFSVPFDAGLRDDAVVMASHAIFPRDGGMEAPASVVGLQFQHSALLSRFISITSKKTCPTCYDCASEELDCFVLDNNGYIVLAEDKNLTGRFFGEVEGAVMDSLRTGDAVFKKVSIFDYQGLCLDDKNRTSNSDANFILTPFTHFKLLVQWVFGQLLWLLFDSNLSHLWYGTQASASPFGEAIYYDTYDFDDEMEFPVVDEDKGSGPREKEEVTLVPLPCDQKTSLYLLQYEGLQKYKYTSDDCSRPHLAQRIPHTNLVLVVINSMFETCEKKVMSSPVEIRYNGTDPACQKLFLNDLPRRRLSDCFSENPLEHEVKLCGGCARVKTNIILFVVVWSMLYLGYMLHH
ncbi:hypothetical protein B7P43_G10508 [Cryptotermes secundus]|uniref:Voltage-dependent calcium channel alpha-2/delta subunit conserved region domain-containing protein n=1 Tax=Cryptotermes secundus TaxID=105785 RepID=A0A2J7PJ61_9NEOP|nr:hypothetical protein B7P43_G10508 [Cryptotermes secundus]